MLGLVMFLPKGTWCWLGLSAEKAQKAVRAMEGLKNPSSVSSSRAADLTEYGYQTIEFHIVT
jgi:hypothetical protein